MNTYNKHRYIPDLSDYFQLYANNRQNTSDMVRIRQQMGRYTNDIECEMDSQRLLCLDDAGFRADNRRQIDGDHSLPLCTAGFRADNSKQTDKDYGLPLRTVRFRQNKPNSISLKRTNRSTISPKGLKYHGLRPLKALDRSTNGHNATKCSVNTADKGSQLPMMTDSKAVTSLTCERISVDFSQRARIWHACVAMIQRAVTWLRDFLRAMIWGLDDGGVCVFLGGGGYILPLTLIIFFLG